ncbi:MAG: urease accessory protein UreD [Acidobacteria bacterium]|nr:urease accessory protein UreD [Acidobacteriota bacterium]
MKTVERYRVEGRLRLRFERHPAAGQTVVTVGEQHPPLQVIRGFPLDNGGALVHLHNLSGGVLGGDGLRVTMEVGPEAGAQVTSTGATRIYRSRSGAPAAVQVTEIRLGENAWMEYLPDPVIPFAGSRYRQETRIEMGPGAGLFWWETVAPGREARRELFDYELLQIESEVAAEGQPVALERIRLEPGARPLSSPARLGPYRYWATFYICRVGVEAARWAALEKQLEELAGELTRPSEVSWGVSALVADGLMVRGLSVKGREITSGLMVFWRTAKRELYGQEAIAPRKVY